MTVGSASLTFTASDWEVAQTVTVSAGEDGDAANGTATIVHGVSSSGDYDGETADSVTVTERDSDTASTAVSLSVLPGAVPEASSGQAVVVTATLNSGTRGEATKVAVTVGAGGDGAESVTDYGAVAGFTLTIPADSVSGTATFTLSPVGDKVDEADESVTVGGTVAGGGLNVLSAELTITDDDERGVTVAPTALTVDEGGSTAYTVVLESEPTETVRVRVTRDGDGDVTVGSASLTFTASDWEVAQTVRVSAGEDGDAANGTATIVHGVSSSGDYGGEAAASVTVTERDSDTASTAVSLSVLPGAVPEASSGQAVVVTATLNSGTRGEATEVAVTVGAGGDGAEPVTDYGAVAGFTLTIPADSATGTATFTLSPVDDKVDEADESVTVGGTVDGGGLNVLPAELTITDDDERGVAVTPTGLTVDEGGSTAYTVVLESEPTETVRVSVTGTGDGDVTVGSTSLTFTASDWDVAQTVRVSAGEDEDAANGTATIVHGVSSSGDYDGEAAASVTVTERDSDTDSTAVSLSVLPTAVPEASSGQVVVVTATLNGGTRGAATEVAVTVGAGGDGAESVTDYEAVAGFTLTIAAEQVSGTATFTLSPVGDKVDEADETLTVGGIVAGGGLNVLPAELTITDDDERGVAVAPTALTVDEGGSAAYTVVLESEPTESVRVSVTRTGDRDVTVGSTSLTFTASDWETAQTVTVSAGEDGDAANGTATIAHGVSSSGDYGGATASSVTVTERDSDTASTAVSLSVLPGVVPEASSGQAVVVTATLNGGTRGEATEVAVTVGAGGDGAEPVTDYGAVAGFTLTIAAEQVSGTATFTLSPVDDKVDEADETLTVGGTGAGGGLNVLPAELTITDDDERGVAVAPTALTVDEGGSAAYTVVLESEPTESVTVSVTRTGDRDVTVGSTSLTFTASDWDVAQTVTVSAGEDGDAANGTATIAHGVSSSGDYGGATVASVTVTERDSDTASTAVSLSVLPGVVPEASSGQAVVVTATLNGGTRGEATEVAVTVGAGGDGAEPVTDYGAVAGFTLMIAAEQVSGTATFTLSPVDDKVDEADETLTVGGTVAGGGLNVLSVELTITDDDERGVAVTPTALTVDEGGSTAYTVVLESEPTETVTVSVTGDGDGDGDVTVGSASLTFTASDWDVAQTVTVSAGEDGDAANGTATIVHGVSSSGDYGGEAADSVTVTERDSDTASTSVSLSVLPAAVPEASAGAAVVVAATLNGGTRGEATEVTVALGHAVDTADPVTDYAAVKAFTLTIEAEQVSGTATFTLSPVDDKVDEEDETVMVSGTMTAIGLSVAPAAVTITDDDTSGVSVSPTALTVDEGGSGTYTVVLASEPTASVTVSVTVSGDEDLTVDRTSLTFTASDWEAAQTVTVSAGDDEDVVNGTATITQEVASEGDYGGLNASSVSVTEQDNDRGGVTPQAWLARFGRTVADQVIDAVDGRLREAPRSGFQGRIAGQSLPGAPLAAADDRPGAARQVSNTVAPHTHDSHEPDDEWPRIRGVMDRDLLTGTSFVLTAGSKESGYRSVWGRGAIARFDGRTRDLSLDGEVLSGMVGADWSRGRGVAGLLAAHSRGEGSFRGAQGESRIEAAVTGFYPYGRYAVNERFSAWGVAGYGEGDLTLVPDGGAALTAGMDLTMVAMGGRGVLLTWPEYGGLELAAKFDAMATRINSESVAGAMEAARAEVMRGRLGLEGTWRGWQVGSGRIAPAFEIGIRYDGGDAETGFGADIGGGLAWSDSERGIKAEVRARGLITHQDRSFRERGLSGTFTWDADASSALGWSLALRQTLGPSASDGMDALLSRVTAGFGFNGEDESDQRRFEATLGYGVALFGGRFAGTPEVGLALSDAGREYSVGWRLSLNQRGRTSFTLAVQATRRETLNHTPEYGVDLRLAAHW